MGKEQYISLIAKKLNNELNIAELRELNGWLSSNSANPELLSDFQHIWDTVASYKSAEVFDSSAAFNKFSQKYDLTADTAPATSAVAPKSGSSALKMAMVAITAIAIFLGGYFLSNKLTPTFSNDQMAALPIQLTDNASATLKPNTSLKFDTKKLTVSKLNGGAYFNLEKQTEPLSFDLSNTKIMANNAKMSLQNYKGDNLIAEIEKGSVTLKNEDETQVVTSGSKIIISKEKGTAPVIVEGNSDNAFNWSKGILSFDNTPLLEVFTTIEQFYGVNIEVIDDSVVTGRHFTAINMQPKNLLELLDLLSSSIDMVIKKSSNGRDIEISEIKNVN